MKILKNLYLDDAVNNYYIYLLENGKLEKQVDNKEIILHHLNNGVILQNTLNNSLFIPSKLYEESEIEQILDKIDTLKPEWISFGDLCPNLTNKLKEKYPNALFEMQNIATLKKEDLKLFANDKNYKIVKVDNSNIDLAIDFLRENDFYPSTRENWIREYKNQQAKYGYLVFDKDKLIGHCCIVYSTSDYFVLWGVLVKQEYRNQGISKIMVAKLCNELLTISNKDILLYYTKEIIGNIYKKIGFKDVSQLLSLTFKND
ncbi:GNAT family N-acetyltransferase [Mycoplasmopsis gallinacea]|uniref:GNAT family N-acetyltransferase n=1 Tax=Mycoplasmopsis gallinacea TaxID=29556 RepID=A0A6H0V5Q0_9BACT|nr:GNAT family N-acetyltransferase [Mycoplasmopsis gallinacea]QIW62357.1 GNAT family N-acetyltransferase [Mycoplasmopsis gallinacea]